MMIDSWTGPVNAGQQVLADVADINYRVLGSHSNDPRWVLTSDHPEMDGHPIGVYRKFGRDQGMRKILPQACG
jgi:hypothetical protein